MNFLVKDKQKSGHKIGKNVTSFHGRKKAKSFLNLAGCKQEPVYLYIKRTTEIFFCFKAWLTFGITSKRLFTNHHFSHIFAVKFLGQNKQNVLVKKNADNGINKNEHSFLTLKSSLKDEKYHFEFYFAFIVLIIAMTVKFHNVCLT